MNPPDLPARPATDLCLFMGRWLDGSRSISACLNQTQANSVPSAMASLAIRLPALPRPARALA